MKVLGLMSVSGCHHCSQEVLFVPCYGNARFFMLYIWWKCELEMTGG